MDYTELLPPLPAPVAHVHSDGDFCQDRYYGTDKWPVDFFTKEQLRAHALAAIAAAAPAIRRAERGLLQRQCEVLRAERDQARAAVDNAVKLLTSIHSLLYPAPLKMADGRTLVFRPTDPDPHEVLQELSDRIRALPDEIAALGAAAIRALPEEP